MGAGREIKRKVYLDRKDRVGGSVADIASCDNVDREAVRNTMGRDDDGVPAALHCGDRGLKGGDVPLQLQCTAGWVDDLCYERSGKRTHCKMKHAVSDKAYIQMGPEEKS